MPHTAGTIVPPSVAPDNLATCTQLEADIALCEWHRQRHLPPALRIVGDDPALAAYEATLDLVRDAIGNDRVLA